MSYLDQPIHSQPFYSETAYGIPHQQQQQQPYGHSSLAAQPFSENDASGSKAALGAKIKSKITYKESPVKAACLACRAKKAKCDGARPVCGACHKKSLECQYVKSRRGGARKKREVQAPSALQEFLKKLDGLLGIPEFKVEKGVKEPSDDTTDIVREFASRDEIFRCYYNEVHPFVTVMPIRKHLPEILPTLLPVSPFLLAAQAILVLVPHPNDPEPKSANSKRLRSAASHAFAEQATAAIERLVEAGQRSLECVQALTILAIWEWGSTGSIERNRGRTGHAMQLAMEMGLHDMDKYSNVPLNRVLEGAEWQKDMARRTWWATYVNQLISAMVTGTQPVMSADDERIKVHYPVCSIDDQSWPRWIEANRQCLRIFSTVNTVYYSHLMPGGGVAAWGAADTTATEDMKDKMRKTIYGVDSEITEMMRIAEETAVIELVPGGEEEVVRNQQLSARLGLAVVHIHIHRQQAFPEVSLFSKMICGLPKMPDAEEADSPSTTANQSAENASPATSDPSPHSGIDENEAFDFIDEMWQPDTYPETLPEPWFTQPGGAGALYAPVDHTPVFQPPVSASIVSYHSDAGDRRPSTVSTSSNRPHKAWGVDDNDKPDEQAAPAAPSAEIASQNLFPPGVSLARCATAAHTIVRLEVLHRSAVIALWDGPPKWMPFCACGLVTGAYSFLLLALAVQAESLYNIPTEEALDQIDGLLTNVKVIVAGLEAYGTMWAGIDVMASEVRAALEAATQLPFEIRCQLNIANKARAAAQIEQGAQSNMPPAIAQAEYNPSYGFGSNNGYNHDHMGPLEDNRFTELSPQASDDGRHMSVEKNIMPMHMNPVSTMNGFSPVDPSQTHVQPPMYQTIPHHSNGGLALTQGHLAHNNMVQTNAHGNDAHSVGYDHSGNMNMNGNNAYYDPRYVSHGDMNAAYPANVYGYTGQHNGVAGNVGAGGWM